MDWGFVTEDRRGWETSPTYYKGATCGRDSEIHPTEDGIDKFKHIVYTQGRQLPKPKDLGICKEVKQR